MAYNMHSDKYVRLEKQLSNKPKPKVKRRKLKKKASKDRTRLIRDVAYELGARYVRNTR